jgi:hypothetical protein
MESTLLEKDVLLEVINLSDTAGAHDFGEDKAEDLGKTFERVLATNDKLERCLDFKFQSNDDELDEAEKKEYKAFKGKLKRQRRKNIDNLAIQMSKKKKGIVEAELPDRKIVIQKLEGLTEANAAEDTTTIQISGDFDEEDAEGSTNTTQTEKPKLRIQINTKSILRG